MRVHDTSWQKEAEDLISPQVSSQSKKMTEHMAVGRTQETAENVIKLWQEHQYICAISTFLFHFLYTWFFGTNHCTNKSWFLLHVNFETPVLCKHCVISRSNSVTSRAERLCSSVVLKDRDPALSTLFPLHSCLIRSLEVVQREQYNDPAIIRIM